MIFTIASQALLSLTIIIVLHYLYNFFKQNLTTPKVRDLVNKPNEEYKKIYTAINSEHTNKQNTEEEKEKRKIELKNYMKSLIKKKEVTIQEDTTTYNDIYNGDIKSFDLGNNSNYSAF